MMRRVIALRKENIGLIAGENKLEFIKRGGRHFVHLT